MKVCLFQNRTLPGTAEAAVRARAAAKALGFGVVPRRDAAKADLVLVLGGDGTVLRAVREFGPLGLPFLGVNTGSLGYLSGTLPADIEAALRAFRDGACETEDRLLLRVHLPTGRGERTTERFALNDVVALRSDTGRVVGLTISVDGCPVTDCLCDGLIVASPTGSTAYSLSAGGPIVMPGAHCLLVTPLCPHTLSSRPIVLPADRTVTVTVSRAESPLSCSTDGILQTRLEPGDSFSVSAADRSVRLVFPSGRNPFAALQDKLGWKGAFDAVLRK